MEFVRFQADQAQPLEGATNVHFVPLRSGPRLVAMVLHFDRKGDTGKREVAPDVLISVIAGEGRVRSGGSIADLKAGDVALLPGGILYQIWTADSQMQMVMMTVGAASA